MKVFIGIDNGITGSVGIITEHGDSFYYKTPVKECLAYSKSKAFVKKVDVNALFDMLEPFQNDYVHCMVERPLVNPMRFDETMSAVVSADRIMDLLERMGDWVLEVIGPKDWQRAILPSGLWTKVKDKAGRERLKAEPKELKKASLAMGGRLFPRLDLKGFTDCDGLLIAEYCRRKTMNIIQGAHH